MAIFESSKITWKWLKPTVKGFNWSVFSFVSFVNIVYVATWSKNYFEWWSCQTLWWYFSIRKGYLNLISQPFRAIFTTPRRLSVHQLKWSQKNMISVSMEIYSLINSVFKNIFKKLKKSADEKHFFEEECKYTSLSSRVISEL